jgi:hypothetical protein
VVCTAWPEKISTQVVGNTMSASFVWAVLMVHFTMEFTWAVAFEEGRLFCASAKAPAKKKSFTHCLLLQSEVRTDWLNEPLGRPIRSCFE